MLSYSALDFGLVPFEQPFFMSWTLPSFINEKAANLVRHSTMQVV
jgi:hypothetical protein